MNSKVQGILLSFFLLITVAFCKVNHAYKGTTLADAESCCIDTFKLKYEAEIHGRKRSVDENIYVGMIQPVIKINNKEYKKLVFGDSINSVIALVRQDSNKLNYIDIMDFKALNGEAPEDLKEDALLYFDKEINDKWKVDIDNSFFWRREIKFMGIIQGSDGNVYVYNVNADEGYLDLGNHVSKIYYSREKGFLKFEIKTHWFPVEVNKLK